MGTNKEKQTEQLLGISEQLNEAVDAMESDEKLMSELSEFSRQFNEVMDEIKAEREEYWNSLSKEEQLKCFCAVTERIFEGETKGHSYRGMLYTVFGFGTEAYARAQLSGFLGLHNSIYVGDEIEDMLTSFAEYAKIEDPKKLVKDYLEDRYV